MDTKLRMGRTNFIHIYLIKKQGKTMRSNYNTVNSVKRNYILLNISIGKKKIQNLKIRRRCYRL